MERKVLFVHDGPMYFEESSGQYLGVHYDDKLISRYRFLGNRVSFLMRLKSILPQEATKFSPIKSQNFSFIEIPNFKSVSTYKNKSKAKQIINQAIIDHDLIIVRLPSAAGTIAFKTAKKLNKPVLVEFVACVFDALWNYDWRGKLLAHYKSRQYQKLMHQTTHAIYVTNHFLQSRYPSNGKSIGCSDVEILSLDSTMIKKRFEKIENQNGPLVLGTIAALDVPYKGQADVIKAIGILKKHGILFKYKVVGQGNPNNLKKEIFKNNVDNLVEIIGPLPHTEIFSFLEEIDLYIQPSKQEGLPRALIEAMSKACPALGARTAGIPELIDDDCIFQPGNINQIAEKLKVIKKQWLIEKAGTNFKMANQYRKENLDARRIKFYNEFLTDYGL